LSQTKLPGQKPDSDEDEQPKKGRNMAYATQVFHEFHRNKKVAGEVTNQVVKD